VLDGLIQTVFVRDDRALHFPAPGSFQLAQLLQYIPLPVIGGYLAYVGYFCFCGGASLAAGVEVTPSHHPLSPRHVSPVDASALLALPTLAS
jgi:MFS superfamily sulfate permease-like transporter